MLQRKVRLGMVIFETKTGFQTHPCPNTAIRRMTFSTETEL